MASRTAVSAADGSGGRPDERFARTVEVPQKAGVSGEGTIWVSVVANVNLTRGSAKIAYVHPVPEAPRTRLPERSPVTLRFKTRGNKVLGVFPLEVKLNTDLHPGDDQVGLVDVVLSVEAAARVIEVIVGERVADVFIATDRPPRIGGVRRVRGDGQELRFALELERANREGESCYAQLTTDGGKTWHTVAVGLREPAFSLDARQFRKGDVLQIRAGATNGFETNFATSEPMRV